jgi:hypothetical protein
MPRASIRATLDVRLRCERFSSLRKQDWIGAPKNTAQTIIAPIRIALTNTGLMNTTPKNIAQMIMGRTRTVLTNTAPKNTILKSIDRGTWVGETAVLRWREETE